MTTLLSFFLPFIVWENLALKKNVKPVELSTRKVRSSEEFYGLLEQINNTPF